MKKSQSTSDAHSHGRLLCAVDEQRTTASCPEMHGYLFVESRTSRGQPAPLVCVLHGFGGADGGLVGRVLDWASEHGAHAIIAKSAAPTWDILERGYGPDVANLDKAIHWALCNWSIDRHHVGLAGFSDGASYALTIGLKNGDCFSHVMAFSPGFVMPANPKGRPVIHIVHGADDDILPVACGQGIAQRLHENGYSVKYQEFDGEHVVPREVVNNILDAFCGSSR